MKHISVLFLCAAFAPLAAAQTVWRASEGPRTISGNYTVPAGSSLTIEAGVLVRINSNSRLVVDGTLNANGTSTAPVKFVGADNWSALLTVAGTLNAKYGDIGVQTQTMSGGSLRFEDTTFTGVGMLGNSSDWYMFRRTPYVELNRCSFVGPAANLYISEVILNIRNTRFSGGAWGSVNYGYVILDNVSSDAAPNTALSFGTDHPLYVNNLTVSNAGGSALNLGGGNWGSSHFLGSNNTFTGNGFPVSGGGFLPGSTVPTSGNVNNRVLFGPTGDFGGRITLAPLPVPYQINGYPTLYGGLLEVLPGTTFKMSPGSGLNIDVGAFRARGRKGQPITFERLDPSQPWRDIHFDHDNELLTHLVVDGSDQGVNGAYTYIQDSLFRNNAIATQGGAMSKFSVFQGNSVAYQGGHIQSPGNSYLNNVLAIRNPGTSTVDARNNWWGSSAGPTPGQIQGSVAYSPFLTAPPSANDAPYITVNEIQEGIRPGDKFTITWKSDDDSGVSSHRILFSKAGNWVSYFTQIGTVPGSRKSFEWTVPDIGPQTLTDPAYIRVVAVDAAGRERYDEVPLRIFANYVVGDVNFTTPLAGKAFRSGDRMSLTWTHNLNSNYGFETFVFVDGYGVFPMGGGFVNYGVWDHIKMPLLSTDRARIGMRVGEGPSRYKWFFSPYFSIRPDSRIGDAPPSITLTAPAAGTTVAAGSPLSIAWIASDDEAVRSYEIHGSYDGGRSWHTIAQDIPGAATSTTWVTATGTGIPDAMIRVVAIDHRFQRSSTLDTPIRIGGATTAATLSGISVSPTTVAGGGSVQGTVTLSGPAPSTGATVSLSSSNSAARVPTSVVVPAGASSTTFTVTTTSVATSTSATITATMGATTRSAALTITSSATALSSVSFTPTSVTGGTSSTGRVTLTAPAPAGGLVVGLSSANGSVVSVPASVTVAAGSSSATFTATTQAVTSVTAVSVTATQGGVSRSATLTVNPPAATDTVRINRAEYNSSKRTLRVDATSTSSSAVLRVYVSSTGALIGTLSSGGSGRYSGTFSVASNPSNVTVKSSKGGTASRNVTLK